MAVAPAAPSRPRPGGGRFLILIGLIVALLGGGGVFFFSTIGSGASIGGAPTAMVVTASKPIAIRHQITDSDLVLAKYAAGMPNTYAKISDVRGLVAEISISQGVVITSDMLARDASLVPAGQQPAFLPLASGYVAVAIPTGEQQGVAGHISVGDYITVIASASVTVFSTGGVQQPGPPRIVTKTVFTNVHVIGLGPAVPNVQPANGGSSGAPAGATSGVTSSLTVEMTQCDAEFMIWFLNNTTVKYTLESFHDYLTAPPNPASLNCATIQAAGGVSQKEVEARFHFTSL